ncbi:MAG: methyltransferase domain-containing protein [Bacteroidia bacterium]
MNPTVPFDAVAQAYDQQFTRSATGRLQRERVHRFIETMPLLKKPARVLELNCGTGEDALWLARKGHQVTATDNSAGMLDAAREKFRNADPLHGSVRFLHYDLNGPGSGLAILLRFDFLELRRTQLSGRVIDPTAVRKAGPVPATGRQARAGDHGTPLSE